MDTLLEFSLSSKVGGLFEVSPLTPPQARPNLSTARLAKLEPRVPATLIAGKRVVGVVRCTSGMASFVGRGAACQGRDCDCVELSLEGMLLPV